MVLLDKMHAIDRFILAQALPCVNKPRASQRVFLGILSVTLPMIYETAIPCRGILPQAFSAARVWSGFMPLILFCSLPAGKDSVVKPADTCCNHCGANHASQERWLNNPQRHAETQTAPKHICASAAMQAVLTASARSKKRIPARAHGFTAASPIPMLCTECTSPSTAVIESPVEATIDTVPLRRRLITYFSPRFHAQSAVHPIRFFPPDARAPVHDSAGFPPSTGPFAPDPAGWWSGAGLYTPTQINCQSR